MKQCLACNQDVPTTTIGKCPLCGAQKGYGNSVVVTDHMHMHDEVHRTLERITETRTINKKSERVSLVIFAVSIIVAILIPTSPLIQPFAILTAVFLGVIPLSYTSYHTERTHLIDRD